MNKDQVKGKIKDVGGRIERQAGEWTGDSEKQVRGAVKQVEGKLQKAWGDAKDAQEAEQKNKADQSGDDSAKTEDDRRPRRKAS